MKASPGVEWTRCYKVVRKLPRGLGYESMSLGLRQELRTTYRLDDVAFPTLSKSKLFAYSERKEAYELCYMLGGHHYRLLSGWGKNVKIPEFKCVPNAAASTTKSLELFWGSLLAVYKPWYLTNDTVLCDAFLPTRSECVKSLFLL